MTRAALLLVPLGLPAAPVINPLSPTRQVLLPAQDLVLQAGATGTGSLNYRWSHNGQPISGATAGTLTVRGVTFQDSGWYVVEVSDSTGAAQSAPMFVQVAPEKTQVRFWGNRHEGKSDAFIASTDIIDISVGYSQILTLHRNGKVSTWPLWNTPLPVPADLADVVSIAAGDYYALALKGDGTVRAWGYGAAETTLPAGLNGVVAIAAGDSHAHALKSDGTIVSWGASHLAAPSGLSEVVAIGAGKEFSVALKRSGEVVAWGNGYFGQTAVPSGLTNVIAISASGANVLALKRDGTVVAWGNAYYGANTVPVGTMAEMVCSAFDHSLALTKSGAIVGWGNNSKGQCTVPSDLDAVWKISGGDGFSYAIRDPSADQSPRITSSPSSQTRPEESAATFTVAATGTAPLAYQWRRNGVAIAGGTSTALTLSNLKRTDAGVYDVVVSNHKGSVTSRGATLTVNPLATVNLISAARQVVEPAQPVRLQVEASGVGSLRYQWLHNGRPVPGADRNELNVPAATHAATGWYAVDVTNAYGTRRSASMFVLVAPTTTLLRGWGNNEAQQLAFPPTVEDAVAVAAGFRTTLAIRRDGSVSAWGENARLVPAGITNAVAVAGGQTQVLVLLSDGTVRFGGSYPPPAGLTNVVAIAAGRHHSVALKSDGSIVAWGAEITFDTDEIPVDVTQVVSVAAGFAGVMVLKQDGSVDAWGIAKPALVEKVDAIASGHWLHYARKADGTYLGWGTHHNATTQMPNGLRGITAIVPGYDHVLALLDTGAVVGWGENAVGQANVPDDLSNVFALAAGIQFSVALCDATATGGPTISVPPLDGRVVEGDNALFSVRAYGRGPLSYQWQTAVPGTTTWQNIVDSTTLLGSRTAVLRVQSVSADTNGFRYRCVVSNTLGTVASGAAALEVQPPLRIENRSATRQVLAPGARLVLEVAATGAGPVTYQWTHLGRSIDGATGRVLAVDYATTRDSGYYVAMVTDSNGTKPSPPFFVTVAPETTEVVGWGDNSYRQLATPQGLTSATAIAAGGYHSLALLRDGTVVGWDRYQFAASIPPGLSDVAAISAGPDYSIALKSDGTVTAWGEAAVGQTSVPRDLSGVVAITTGGYAPLALRHDGTVVRWGYRVAPPPGLSHVIAVASGTDHYLALRSDGTMVGWGRSDEGQIALPAGLSDVVAIAAGGNHSMAVRANGEVVAWGDNSAGQTTLPGELRSPVVLAMNWKQSEALTATGLILGWGSNSSGEASPPIQRANWLDLSAGLHFGLALRDVTPLASPQIVTPPRSRSGALGRSIRLGVSAAGSPLYFRWTRNGLTLPQVRGPNLILGNLSEADAGEYVVEISNQLGAVVSNVAVVSLIPDITESPRSTIAPIGGDVTFRSAATGKGALRYQWMHDGILVAGATGPELTLQRVDEADAGNYTVAVSDDRGTAVSTPAVLGLTIPQKLAGKVDEVGPDIVHQNGNVYDQLLLGGTTGALRADPGQIVRVSYIDLSDDIVQVEFSGAGTLTLSLTEASGPALPAKYNQAVSYMRGHARIGVAAADETTNLSIFSVGRITAVNQALFKEGVEYDGMADLASVSIASANGKFGGLRLANASFFAVEGITGVYAPDVEFIGPVFIGDITAAEDATPVMITGRAGDVRISGGELNQSNGRPVLVHGFEHLKFTAGQTAHGVLLPAATIRGTLERDGEDVTAALVTYP